MGEADQLTLYKALIMNRFLTICLVLMLIVTGAMVFVTQTPTPENPPEITSGKALIGGHFSLINANNEPITDSAFRGKTMLVFFGFTHCPDICPVTLASFTQTLENLGADAEKIAPIFISIDPKRDTPARLKEHMANFDARIIALTGSDEQIKQATAAYKAFYSTGKENEHENHGMKNYNVDHSGFIYLMNKDGEYIKHFPYDISPEELTKALIENIQS